jgi:hypothetical protein
MQGHHFGGSLRENRARGNDAKERDLSNCKLWAHSTRGPGAWHEEEQRCVALCAYHHMLLDLESFTYNSAPAAFDEHGDTHHAWAMNCENAAQSNYITQDGKLTSKFMKATVVKNIKVTERRKSSAQDRKVWNRFFVASISTEHKHTRTIFA